MKRRAAVGMALALLGAAQACSSEVETERRSAVEHGRDLFSSTEVSASAVNRFTCATCHLSEPHPTSTRILPGYVLAGATVRPTFWGGQYPDLLRAINDCRYYFMSAPSAWGRDDAQARAMFAYLASLPPSAPAALPLTIVKIAEDLPRGDPERGHAAYDASCRSCHGAAFSGEGRLPGGIPALPDESVASFRTRFGFNDRDIRVAFIEKVRHGAFLGLSGRMPLYAKEALSDADLSGVVAYLGLNF